MRSDGCTVTVFLSTPSGWRATSFESFKSGATLFYPRPGVRATGLKFDAKVTDNQFLSTPPGGGRQSSASATILPRRFLSTPSGWRATAQRVLCCVVLAQFLSTPSGWRATANLDDPPSPAIFLSTPSGWRATRSYMSRICCAIGDFYPALRVEGDKRSAAENGGSRISIHALRVEGDITKSSKRKSKEIISIHALRVEGDYQIYKYDIKGELFLSTPSGWRATTKRTKFSSVFAQREKNLPL